jgi:glycosyltransferase involved in cell wall biosynthesis
MTDLTIVSATDLNSGGIGRVTYNWAKELANRGRAVRVICSSARDVNTTDFEISTLSAGRFSYYWKDLYYSLKVKLREDLEGQVFSWLGLSSFIDVDYVHMGSVPKSLQDERLARGGVTTNDVDLRKRIDDICYSVYNYHQTEVRDAPNVIVPSPEIKQTLDRYGPSVPAKTTVVPHGVSEKFVQYDSGPDRDQVLFVGGTMPRKGISTLLSAWAEYDGSETLLVAGYGDQKAFASLRNDHGVDRDQAKYLGFVDDDRLLELYRESKVFVLPSFEEGFGIPVLEALAAGTPVVCSDAVGSRFVLDECDGGMTFPAGDATGLRETLATLLSNEVTRKQAGIAGRDHVASNYLWQHVVSTLDSVLFPTT